MQYKVAVFDAVWYNSQSNLVFIRDRTNTSTFVEYLQSAFNTHFRSIWQYHFIHDRPTWAHTTESRTWLNNHNIICLDEYPAASPDLNAIELVWSWMNRYVQRRHPNSQQHLEQQVMDAWNQIPRCVIRGFIDRIRDVCNEIIANQGWGSWG